MRRGAIAFATVIVAGEDGSRSSCHVCGGGDRSVFGSRVATRAASSHAVNSSHGGVAVTGGAEIASAYRHRTRFAVSVAAAVTAQLSFARTALCLRLITHDALCASAARDEAAAAAHATDAAAAPAAVNSAATAVPPPHDRKSELSSSAMQKGQQPTEAVQIGGSAAPPTNSTISSTVAFPGASAHTFAPLTAAGAVSAGGHLAPSLLPALPTRHQLALAASLRLPADSANTVVGVGAENNSSTHLSVVAVPSATPTHRFVAGTTCDERVSSDDLWDLDDVLRALQQLHLAQYLVNSSANSH